MKTFSNVVIAVMFVFYFFGIAMAIKDVNNDTNTDVAVSESTSCVLQDAIMHDGAWFLFNKPCVFDGESSEIMAQIMNGNINCQIAAYAELIDDCYIIHLD